MQNRPMPALLEPIESVPVVPPLRLIRRLATWLSAFASACADAYSAAAQYDDLSRLSDAELGRRGISRADIHRFVRETSTSSHRDG